MVLAIENPTGKFQSKNFVLTNMSTVRQNSYFGDKFLILGVVKNIGNKTFDAVSLLANLYNKKGNLIDVVETTPFFNVGEPNSSSPYKFEVNLNASQLDHYLIQVGGADSDKNTTSINTNASNTTLRNDLYQECLTTSQKNICDYFFKK